VEGKSAGVDKALVSVLNEAMLLDEDIVITYAGGIGSMEDLEAFAKVTKGKIDFTIGSALDLFGGSLPYESIKKIGL
jgi:phosphoribosylformimino-5-aminoimidazole carboxamide ribotide isomerase